MKLLKRSHKRSVYKPSLLLGSALLIMASLTQAQDAVVDDQSEQDNSENAEASIVGNWYCTSSWKGDLLSVSEIINFEIVKGADLYKQTGLIVITETDKIDQESRLEYTANFQFEYKEPLLITQLQDFTVNTMSDGLEFFTDEFMTNLASSQKTESTIEFETNTKMKSFTDIDSAYNCDKQG